jgi:hypothetical protein
MPNGYTAIPQIVSGNLQVTGDLDVKGEVRAGPGTVRARLGAIVSGSPALSFNYSLSNAAQDAAGSDSYLLFWSGADGKLRVRNFRSVSFPQDFPVPMLVGFDNTTHTHTGDTTEDTIYTKTLRGGQIGPNGALRLRFFVSQTAVTTSMTLRVRLGGTLLFSVALTVVGGFWVEAIIQNQNAQNAQSFEYIALKDTNTIQQAQGTAAIDTSADQNLTISLQNTTNSDSQTVRSITLEQLALATA